MPTELINALTDRLGARRVIIDPEAMIQHLTEDRGLFKGEAFAVVFPETVDEVSFVVRQAIKANVSIVPQGGHTGLVGGAIASRAIIIAMGRMNQIQSLDAVNSTMTVEAGCTLHDVQQAARDADRLFPLSLASEGSCQIGGNLSTNAGGVNVLRYGNARELALGLQVVLPDGRILTDLSGLRKNNTGYDLRDLFIGAEGTLGIITAATLKLFPLPRKKVTAFAGCKSAHDALALYDLLRCSLSDNLTAFEYLPRFGLDIVLKHADGTRDPLRDTHQSYVLIELTTPDSELNLADRLEGILADAFERDLVQDATVAASETQSAALWALREYMSEKQKLEGGSIKHDIAVPVSRVAEFIDVAGAACKTLLPGIRLCPFGHMGDGNLHFNISQPVGMDKSEFLAMWGQFNRVVHDVVADFGGSISAEHGIGMLKRDELARYKDPVALDVMRLIKQALDAKGLMNPGKVIPD
ncbi:FAD-binding oxidoreductase [Qingshengfaniella alkalisoli]|uniref:FAD-binding oxidoreductase n=1 Tax=Qingshengfaniella alkalisoli TaxID=2599296 RepID=A0A5B8IAJ1_9RHOB|nr:FAD-binding oxidoreductase [Qingshengfaniella alkalisoli]QDY71515.1 FAD-binding oxidoreductase [Qingshengfaniella alkalisoli]